MSLKAAAALQPEALISIAPPAGRWDFDGIAPPRWLVIQGEQDEIVDPQAVYQWLDTLDFRMSWCACPRPATSSTAS